MFENSGQKGARKDPRPNNAFRRENRAYANTCHLQVQGYHIPHCYGYVDFTRIPQLEHRGYENPYKLGEEHLPPHMKYAAGRDVFLYKNVENSDSLLKYFKNAALGSCVLRGILLEEITDARAFGKDDKFFSSRLFELGTDTLRGSQKSGVMHDDGLNHENALVVPSMKAKKESCGSISVLQRLPRKLEMRYLIRWPRRNFINGEAIFAEGGTPRE